MISLLSSLEQIKEEFADKNIPFDKPGFYDYPNFVANERRDCDYLRLYACFVKENYYSELYLQKAQKEITFIASILHEELVRDGRVGACIDTNTVLSRILEQEGYWNSITAGGLTTIYPASSRIRPHYYWSVDLGNYAAAHVWLFAPPFSVVDITLRLQPFSHGEADYLPEVVFEKSVTDCAVDTKDVINPEIIDLERRRHGISEGELLSRCISNANEFFRAFKRTRFNYSGTILKYIPCAIRAPDAPLENTTSLRLNGRYGIEIYRDIIKPKLEEYRRTSPRI